VSAEVDAEGIALTEYLGERKNWIDKALSECLDRTRSWPPLLREAAAYSVFAGGKRIRPILALATLESVGGKIGPSLPLVCALELIHTYSLIHDDLPAMDNDDFRRGQPTNHKKFGEGVAILAGDALLTAAFSLISDPVWGDTFRPAVRLAALYELSVGAGGEGMVGGQLMDIILEGKQADPETLRYIHSHKTGALIRASIRFGAILGDTPAPQLLALTRFAERVGLAFQIADDILDVVGTKREMGKSTQRDSENLKNTYPALFGLDRSREMAESLVNEAVDCLQAFDHRADSLRRIARFIVERKK